MYGYNPKDCEDVDGFLLATGPNMKPNKITNKITNIDIYHLSCSILSINEKCWAENREESILEEMYSEISLYMTTNYSAIIVPLIIVVLIIILVGVSIKLGAYQKLVHRYKKANVQSPIAKA